MRLMIRHIAKDGHTVKAENVRDAKNPKHGAQAFAHANYIASGERIDVLLLRADSMLNYEVTRSRVETGLNLPPFAKDGVRVRYAGKNA